MFSFYFTPRKRAQIDRFVRQLTEQSENKRPSLEAAEDHWLNRLDDNNFEEGLKIDLSKKLTTKIAKKNKNVNSLVEASLVWLYKSKHRLSLRRISEVTCLPVNRVTYLYRRLKKDEGKNLLLLAEKADNELLLESRFRDSVVLATEAFPDSVLASKTLFAALKIFSHNLPLRNLTHFTRTLKQNGFRYQPFSRRLPSRTH